MQIKYTKQALKFLQKQPPAAQKRLTNAISQIPLGDIKKLQGQKSYRLRVGDYRIIFDHLGNIIEIIKIGNRGDIYK